jgi:hypothetical protein
MHDKQQSQDEYQSSYQPANDGLHGRDTACVVLPVLISANPEETPEYCCGDLQRAGLASWGRSARVLRLFGRVQGSAPISQAGRPTSSFRPEKAAISIMIPNYAAPQKSRLQTLTSCTKEIAPGQGLRYGRSASQRAQRNAI